MIFVPAAFCTLLAMTSLLYSSSTFPLYIAQFSLSALNVVAAAFVMATRAHAVDLDTCTTVARQAVIASTALYISHCVSRGRSLI